MSLSAALQRNIGAFMTNMKSLQTSVTLRNKTAAAAYNPSTGVVTETNTDESVNMLLISYKKSEIDEVHIQNSDRKAFFLTADVTNQPTKDSQVIAGGLTYEVVQVIPDVTGAYTTLQLRLPS